MKFFFVFCVFVVLQSIVFCRKNPSRKQTNDHEMKWHDFKKLCTNQRTKQMKRFQSLEPSQCHFMVPGLSFMEHGAVRNYFFESFKEFSHPKFEKVFSFTCDQQYNHITEKFRFYNLPHEIIKITESHQETREKRILSIEAITQELISQESGPITENEKDNFSNLPFFLFNENSTQSVGFLRITTSSYEAQLRNDITPNELVMQEYNNLPEHWKEDVQAYYEFVMRFGTHVRRSTTFGGSLFILVPYGSLEKKVEIVLVDDNITVDGLVKDVINMKGDNRTKVIVYPAGGSSPLESIKEWIDSVHHNPIPIESNFIPMNKFLDNSDSPRSKSFAEFIRFESDFQKYKKNLYKLKLTKHGSSIARKLYELLQDQIKNVCPSKHLNKIIKDNLEKEKNFKFDKFWFTCQHNFIEQLRNTNSKYFVASHFCFSFNVPRNDCYYPSINLPKDNVCLEFFPKASCIGKSLKIYKAIDLSDLFQKINVLSYRLCET